MRLARIYRIVAYLVALEVAVQAATHAYGSAGLGHWIWSDGHTVTKADLDEGGVRYTGRAAAEMHGLNGALVIPLLVLAFLVIALVVRRTLPGALQWAAFVVGLAVVQVALGFATIAVPELGILHAVNALAMLLVAVHAARLPVGERTPSGSPERQVR